MTDVASPPKITSTEIQAEDEVPHGEPVRFIHKLIFRDTESGITKDETLEAMKARVEQMEREAAQLRDMQAGGYTHVPSPTPVPQATAGTTATSDGDAMETEEEKEAADSRSVYVGNVDYGATPEEIQAHFQSCGTINRVTILCDKFTGHPKGYAYVEFAEPTHVQHAVVLNDSMFRGRLIKVNILNENLMGAYCFTPSTSSTQIMNGVSCFRRLLSTAVSTTYPFSSNAILPPAPIPNPTPSLLKGKGLMAQLYKTLPSAGTQKLLVTLFSRRHPGRLLPGSILTVTSTHAPTTFTGVLLAIRRRGPGTSFVLRNVIQRTGVEMRFFVGSPHLKDIQVVQKASRGAGRSGRGGLRRAKLFYLRDSPEKMSQISAGMRG
ncbi:hypothetical protein BU17DRAFT_37724 [Hysterangium stoloniferum]|nr:hypothetical protein BU17DRAFT_37724 [Hysterangium stoloniferum]